MIFLVFAGQATGPTRGMGVAQAIRDTSCERGSCHPEKSPALRASSLKSGSQRHRAKATARGVANEPTRSPGVNHLQGWAPRPAVETTVVGQKRDEPR